MTTSRETEVAKRYRWLGSGWSGSGNVIWGARFIPCRIDFGCAPEGSGATQRPSPLSLQPVTGTPPERVACSPFGPSTPIHSCAEPRAKLRPARRWTPECSMTFVLNTSLDPLIAQVDNAAAASCGERNGEVVEPSPPGRAAGSTCNSEGQAGVGPLCSAVVALICLNENSARTATRHRIDATILCHSGLRCSSPAPRAINRRIRRPAATEFVVRVSVESRAVAYTI